VVGGGGKDVKDYDKAVIVLSNCFAKGVKDLSWDIVEKALDTLKTSLAYKKGFKSLYNFLNTYKFEKILITASPKEVTKIIINEYPFNIVLGMSLEKIGKKYTGKLINAVTIESRKNFVEKLIKKKDLSIGISDSIFDIMYTFEKVKHRFLIKNVSSIYTEKNYYVVSSLDQVISILKEKIWLFHSLS